MAAPWRRIFPGTWATSEAIFSSRLPGKLIAEAMLGPSVVSVNATATPSGVSATASAGNPAAVGTSVIAGTGIPSGVGVSASIGNLAATGSGVSSLSGVQAASNVGMATATGGASIPATASPSGVSGASGVGTAQGIGSSNVIPFGVAASSVIGTATADGGGPVSAIGNPEGVQATASVGQVEQSSPPAVRPLNITYRFTAKAFPEGVEALASVGACGAVGQAVIEAPILEAKPEPTLSVVAQVVQPVSALPILVEPEPIHVESLRIISSSGIAQAVGVETSGASGKVVPFGHGAAAPSGVQASAQVGLAQATGIAEPPATEYDDSEEIALLLMMLGAA